MTDIFDKLKAPFPIEDVEWRVGATTKDGTRGLALAYIDARHVMDRLDEVVTPAGWQCRYSHAGEKTVCELGLVTALHNVDGVPDSAAWIWKADGAGDTDVEAAKGALSDAFKRAAVRWGIGRYLYKLPSIWVGIEPQGRSHVIAASELPKLQRLLADGNAAKMADPSPIPETPEEVLGMTESENPEVISVGTGEDGSPEWRDWAYKICLAAKDITTNEGLKHLVDIHEKSLDNFKKQKQDDWVRLMDYLDKQFRRVNGNAE